MELVLERLEGAEGVVHVTWEAVIRDGISADDDISVTRGELLFQSQERSKTFSIQVIYYTIILYTLLIHSTVYIQWNLLITATQWTGQSGNIMYWWPLYIVDSRYTKFRLIRTLFLSPSNPL